MWLEGFLAGALKVRCVVCRQVKLSICHLHLDAVRIVRRFLIAVEEWLRKDDLVGIFRGVEGEHQKRICIGGWCV